MKSSLTKILLVCGILSALLYIGADIFAAMQYEGYSYTSQAISELSAVGAPTRGLLSITGNIYLLLILAFGFGALFVSGKNKTLRIISILIIIYGLIGFSWAFAPMSQRNVLGEGGGTTEDTLHLIIGGIDTLLFLLMLGFGAFSLNKKFKVYSIITIILLLVFGTLMSLDVPKVAANEPTPWLGITERIAIFSPMIWISVLAIVLLLRKEQNKIIKGNLKK